MFMWLPKRRYNVAVELAVLNAFIDVCGINRDMFV